MRVFLFDIDGTLIDAGGAGRRSMTAAFARMYGIDQPFAAFDLVGCTDLNILVEICRRHRVPIPAGVELERFFDFYVACLERELQKGDGFRVLAGSGETVAWLSEQSGALVGLGTGNVEAGARLKLARTGYGHLFRFGGFGTDGPDRAAVLRKGIERARGLIPGVAENPADAWVVGDSVRDVEAAKAVGATSVAIAAGWQSIEVLRAAGPDLAFASMERFLDWLKAGG
jgi:phosphoglycolate phosphatase-like HAD superfamily hydrolase